MEASVTGLVFDSLFLLVVTGIELGTEDLILKDRKICFTSNMNISQYIKKAYKLLISLIITFNS